MAEHKIYKIGGEIFVEVTGDSEKYFMEKFHTRFSGQTIHVKDLSPIYPKEFTFSVTELLNQDGDAVGDKELCEIYLADLKAVTTLENVAPIVIAKFNKVENETTFSAAGAIGDTDITVTSPTGFAAGKYITMYSVAANRFYVGYVLGVAGSVISLDTPLDFAYQIGDFVTSGITDMSVNGSVTPVIFALRNTDAAIGTSAHLARIIINGETDTLGTLGEFGDIAALTKGIVLRKKDGIYRNVFNVKTNAEMKSLMYDFELISSGGPQSPDGFSGRFTFTKLGPYLEIKPGEDVELIIQDDLTGLLSFEIIVEGHTRSY